MGVYIPDMNFPKSCWDCDLADTEAFCPLIRNGSFDLDLEGRLPGCPLVEMDLDLLKWLVIHTNRLDV